MQWDKLPALSWKNKVALLTYQASTLDQIECPLKHIFEPGFYIREMRIPAGTLFTGREHLLGHECQLNEGEVIMMAPDGKHHFAAPATIWTKPGYHAVVYTLTDIVSRTVHANPDEIRDVAELEAIHFETAESLIKLGSRVNDMLDYQKTLVEFGVTDDEIRPLFEDTTDMVEYQAPYYLADSLIHGVGVFTDIALAAGQEALLAKIGDNRTPVGRYTNHSASPNSEMRVIGNTITLVALKDMPQDTELTVDYRIAIACAKELTACLA